MTEIIFKHKKHRGHNTEGSGRIYRVCALLMKWKDFHCKMGKMGNGKRKKSKYTKAKKATLLFQPEGNDDVKTDKNEWTRCPETKK